jgi:acyl-CoA synthetase (NDP forming)
LNSKYNCGFQVLKDYGGVVFYHTPEDCARAMAGLVNYARVNSRKENHL